MSLASATNRVDYVGNGAVDTYSYTFRIFANTDLLVTVRDTTSNETELTLTTDFTVTGVGDEGGGTIVLVNASQAWLDADGDLLTGYSLTIRRVRPLTQEADIRNQGDFFPETHEDQFDHFIMVDQQQQDEINRSVKLPETVASSGFDASLPADIADNPGLLIAVNDDGDGFTLAADASVIEIPVLIAHGGTNSTVALNNNRVMKSSGGAIVEAAAITANRVIISDANGIPIHNAALTASRILLSDASGFPVANAAVTASRVMLSDASGFPVANAAITANRALASDASGFPVHSAITDTQLGYLANLFGYRRPVLQYSSGTVVLVETGTKGTAGDCTIVFPDGSLRTDSDTTRIRMTISQNAVFNNATRANNIGGLRSGSVSVNTWYALYAVKVTAGSGAATDFVIVADTVLPLAANFATLNSNFGTNGWVYLGVLPYGNGKDVTNAIPKFMMSGCKVTFYNVVVTFTSTDRGIHLAGGSGITTITWTYAAGTAFGSKQVPGNILIGDVVVATGNTTNVVLRDAAATAYIFSYQFPVSSQEHCPVSNVNLNQGLKADIANSVELDILLTGYLDSALGVGFNPVL